MMRFRERLESGRTGRQHSGAVDDVVLTLRRDCRGEDEVKNFQFRSLDLVTGLVIGVDQKEQSRFQMELNVVAVTLRFTGDDPGEFEEIPRGAVPLRIGIVAEGVMKMEHGQPVPRIVKCAGAKFQLTDRAFCHDFNLLQKDNLNLFFFNKSGWRVLFFFQLSTPFEE